MLLTFILCNPEGQKYLRNDLKPRDSMAACFLTQSMQMKTQNQAPLHKPWDYKSLIVLTNLFSPRSQPQIWGCGCCCVGNPLNLHFHPEPQQSWSFSHTCVGPSQGPDAACSSPDPVDHTDVPAVWAPTATREASGRTASDGVYLITRKLFGFAAGWATCQDGRVTRC